MEPEIGDAAGAVWKALDRSGQATLSQLKQRTQLGEPLLMMAIGWLAREEKLAFIREGRTMRVDLKERRAA